MSDSESISLRDYVDSRFEGQEKAVASALAAADRAVSKSEAATEKRFENSNEWRNTVETLQRTYMPRTEFDQAVRALAEKLEAMQKLTWIGLGILLAFQFFIGIAMMFWRKA